MTLLPKSFHLLSNSSTDESLTEIIEHFTTSQKLNFFAVVLALIFLLTVSFVTIFGAIERYRSANRQKSEESESRKCENRLRQYFIQDLEDEEWLNDFSRNLYRVDDDHPIQLSGSSVASQNLRLYTRVVNIKTVDNRIYNNL